MSTVAISAKDVKKLRDMTGAGMMDCKKALSAAGGDLEKAIEELRKRGQKIASKRADRNATEGVVIAKVNDDFTRGIVFKLTSETDFVAKNDDFVAIAQTMADKILAAFPADTEAALALDYGDGMTIGEKALERTGVIGEKIEVAEYASLEAPLVVDYNHMGNRAGVLVALTKASDAFVQPARDVAMQVAAMKPVAVDKDGVDASVVEKEIEIGKEVARNEGKPEAMLEKIAMGKLNKFYKENTLLSQSFVKNSKQNVAQYLQEQDKDLTVTAFKHVKLG
jgi:elongation factor Ts